LSCAADKYQTNKQTDRQTEANVLATLRDSVGVSNEHLYYATQAERQRERQTQYSTDKNKSRPTSKS